MVPTGVAIFVSHGDLAATKANVRSYIVRSAWLAADGGLMLNGRLFREAMGFAFPTRLPGC